MTKPTVGILSMQRVINYGSFLQAYALKQLLKENGAGEVYFVDIIPGRILVENPISKKSRLTRYWIRIRELITAGTLISGLKTFIFFRMVGRSIRKSWPQLNLGKRPNTPFDIVIVGSDEVFNCTQDVPWGYSTQLFGDIPYSFTRKLVSYAGSFGYTNIEKLQFYGIDKEICGFLKRYDAISVRDKNSEYIISKLIGITPKIHIDPVLAYGYKQEINSFKKPPLTASYMIVYSYQDRINDEAEINAITDYARSQGLKLISIFCHYDWCDKAAVPKSPIEVLRWFKYAECIVTDTFHGTIFSIITASNFATLIRPSNRNKVGYLLNSLNLNTKEADANTLHSILSNRVDYNICNSILEHKRNEAKGYLKYILNDI